MGMTRNIILLFLQVLAANTAAASSTNPCAASAGDFCSGLDAAETRQCLARKIHKIESDCAERIDTYYTEHPEEMKPAAEEDELQDNPNGFPSYFGGSRLGADTRASRDGLPKNSSNRIPRTLYQKDAGGRSPSPSKDSGSEIYNPYSNLQQQMNDYYTPSTFSDPEPSGVSE